MASATCSCSFRRELSACGCTLVRYGAGRHTIQNATARAAHSPPCSAHRERPTLSARPPRPSCKESGVPGGTTSAPPACSFTGSSDSCEYSSASPSSTQSHRSAEQAARATCDGPPCTQTCRSVGTPSKGSKLAPAARVAA
eukprot:scaffold50488_cov270-Isochrysis_galbana.AAC.1